MTPDEFLAGEYYEPYEVPCATAKNMVEFRKRDLQLALVNVIAAEKHGPIDGTDRTLHSPRTLARALRALRTLREKKRDIRAIVIDALRRAPQRSLVLDADPAFTRTPSEKERTDRAIRDLTFTIRQKP